MMTKSTFVDAGWDFESVWGIDEGQTYPYLLSIPLDVHVASEEPACGSVSGARTFYHQQTATVTATSADGFIFKHWTERGEVVSTEREYSFQVETHRDLVAHFQPGYKVRYTASAGGSLVGEAYQECLPGEDGSPVEVVPEAGAHFAGWSDHSWDNPREDAAVSEDIAVTAHFETDGYGDIQWYTDKGLLPEGEQDWSDLDSLDRDGDGRSNLGEYEADTDPTKAESFLQIISITPGVPVEVYFRPFSENRGYNLLQSDDLSEGSWQPVWNPELYQLDDERGVFLVPESLGGIRFYKLEARPFLR